MQHAHHRCLAGSWIYLGFWISQRSEYTRVVNMLLVQNMSGFYIYHGSKCSRVTQGSEYAWICLNSFWICLIMLECGKSVRMAFVFCLTIVISCLKWPKAIFLKSKNLILLIVAGSIWYCFYVLDWVFLQVRFQICCYLWGTTGQRTVNLNMLNQWYTQIIYLWCLSNDLFNYFVVVVFLFLVLQRT